MSGSISLSLSQQFDSLGRPLAGGLLSFIKAGTTSTVQNAFQDSTLTLPWANPLTLDAAGRVPQLYFADGFIKIRLTDKNGVTQVVADNILVVGPSSGSGSGPSVDPTTILATGDMKIVYGTGSLTGFVRANGRTIGSSSSGSSERANADTSALFSFLWGADANLAVSGGRGVSAAADWAANKTIALPDFRGRAVTGLDDMGNSAAGRLTSTYFGSAATTLGASGGGQSSTLVTGNLPPYTPAGTITNGTINQNAIAVTGGSRWENSTGGSQWVSATITQNPSTFSGTPQGGTSNPVAVVGPRMLVTIYLKL